LFVGYGVGNLTAPAFNFGFGFNSLNQLTTGVNNVSVGSASLVALTTGDNNVAVCNQSMQNLISGSRNVGLGSLTLQTAVSTNDCTAIGFEALELTSGDNNVGVGSNAGATNTIGTDNTFIGTNADSSAAGLTNATAIGANAIVGASNTIVLGDPTVNMDLVIGDTAAPVGVKVYIKQVADHLQFQLNSPDNTANQISFSRGTGVSYFGPSATNEFHIFGGTTSTPAPLDVVIFPGSSETVRFVSDINRSQEFQGGQSATILVARETIPTINGHILTLQAGGAPSGGTDKNGGPLLLQSGIATGSGSSTIEFYTATAGASGTTDRFPTLKAVIDGAGHLGVGTGAPATSAAVEIASTTGALLLPRMTTAQKNALTAVNGMCLYDTDLNKFQGYENGAWTSFI
jgi:hypothetical protein